MKKEIVIIKIGGRMATNEELLKDFIRELASLTENTHILVVHGGGKEVSELSEKLLGYPPVFQNGIRMTNPEEMDVVEMVLSGRVNKRLVRLFQTNGLKAVGLSGADGSTYLGKSIAADDSTRTGAVTAVNASLISLLLDHGYIPVLSSTTMDKNGSGININADEAALTVAESLRADALLYLSDIPGVCKDNRVIAELSVERAREEIKKGVITGGMIPKVESSIEALSKGVKKIVIGEYGKTGALGRLLEGTQGTSIC
jgi:acetylglutamate kinase